MNLSVAVERAVSTAFEGSPNATNTQLAEDSAPLVARIPLVESLLRMGCSAQMVSQEADFIRSWLERRKTEGYWHNSGELEVKEFLKQLDEPDEVTRKVEEFADHLLACCAPHHLRLCRLYLSKKKVSEVYRSFAGRAAPAPREKNRFATNLRPFMHGSYETTTSRFCRRGYSWEGVCLIEAMNSVISQGDLFSTSIMASWPKSQVRRKRWPGGIRHPCMGW
jgi:hypothetical protein